MPQRLLRIGGARFGVLGVTLSFFFYRPTVWRSQDRRSAERLGPRIYFFFPQNRIPHLFGRFIKPRMSEVAGPIVKGQRLQARNYDPNHAKPATQSFIGAQVHGVCVQLPPPKNFQNDP